MAGLRVWDNREQKPKTVSEEDAEKGIAEGYFQLRSGVELPVLAPDGSVGTIPSDKAAEAFKSGFRLQRPEEVRSTFDQAREETRKAVAEDMEGTAFLQGALKTATFGLSDATVQAFTDIDPEFQKAVAEENPIASTLGEVAGALPVAGPAAAAARGSAALGARAAQAGAGRVGSKAIEFAADGLAYGMGESISDLALGNPEEVASNLILGGGIGGVLGAGTGALAPVAKAAKDAILTGAEKAVTIPTEKLATAVAKRKAKKMGVEGAEELIESGRYRELQDPDKIKSFEELLNEAGIYEKLVGNKAVLYKEEARGLVKELNQQKKQIREQLNKIYEGEKLEKIKLDAEYNKRLEEYLTLRDDVLQQNQAKKQQYQDELDAWKKEKEQLNESIGRAKSLNKKQQAEYELKKKEVRQKIKQIDQENKNQLESWKVAKKELAEQNGTVKKEALKKLEDIEQQTLRQAMHTLHDVEGTIATHASVVYGEGLQALENASKQPIRMTPDRQKNLLNLYNGLLREANDLVLNPNYKTADGNSLAENVVGKILDMKAAGTIENPASHVKALYEIRRTLGESINWKKPDRKLASIYGKINESMEAIIPETSFILRELDSMYQLMSGIRSLSTVYKKDKQVLDPGTVISGIDGAPSIVNSPKLGKAYDKNKFAYSLMATPENRAVFDSFLMNIEEYLRRYGDEIEVAALRGVKELPEKLKELDLEKTAIKESKLEVPSKPTPTAKPDMPDRPSRVDVPDKTLTKPTSPKMVEKPKAPLKGKFVPPSAMVELKKKLMQENSNIKDYQAEDLINIMAMFGGKEGKEKAEMMTKLKDIRRYFLEHPELNTIEKYAHIVKNIGGKHSVEEIRDLLQFQKDVSIMDRLAGDKPGRLADLGILSAIGLGGIDSGITAMAVVKAAHLANSPKAALEVLPAIEKYAQTGRNLMDKFSTGFAKAITSKTAARTAIAPIARGSYESASKGVEENQDPVTFQNKLSASLEPLAHAPNVQIALMSKVVTTQQYLADKLPKDPLAGRGIFTPKFTPSEAQKNEWMRRYQVAENPSAILPKIENGTVTPEEVETFKALYPELFEETKRRMVEQLSQLTEPPPYDKLVTLSFVFGEATDPTLNGAYVTFMQELVANYPKDKVQSNKSMSKLDPQTFMSDGQQVTMR